jgi:4-amino-4-deoxy-L-arabinose transferase-like glycosyltransferase
LTFFYTLAVARLRFAGEPLLGDSIAYYLIAGNLRYHGVFSADPESPRPEAFRPPLYPAVLALLMRLAGYEHFLTKGRLLNFFFLSGAVVAVFFLSRRIFGTRAAFFAGLFQAFSFPCVYSSMQLMVEPLAVLLVSGFVLSATVWLQTGKTACGATAGLLLGLAALARPNLLILLPVTVLFLALRRERTAGPARAGAVLLLAALCLLPILPWTLRNYFSLGGFSLLSTNGGINFYMGHREGFNPTLSRETTDYGAFDRLRKQGISEIEADRTLYRMGFSFLLSHPRDELKNSLLKVRAMMRNYTGFLHPWRLWSLALLFYFLVRRKRPLLSLLPLGGLVLLFATEAWGAARPGGWLLAPATSFPFLYALAVPGLWFGRHKGDPLRLLMVVWVSVLFTGILYLPLARIRWTVDFVAAVMAGAGVDGLMTRLRGGPSDTERK